MFERFTPPARAVLIQAQAEAASTGHGQVGTQHLLLGLLHPRAGGVGADLLREWGVSQEAFAAQVETRPGPVPNRLLFDADAKQVIELTFREALRLGHGDIGTEHVLLSLLVADRGPARSFLEAAGVDHAKVVRTVAERVPGVPARQRRLPRRSGRVEELGTVILPSRPTPPPPAAGLGSATGGAEAALRTAADVAGTGPVGTQHLLLSLAREQGSLAAQALAALGVTPDQLAEALAEAEAAGAGDEGEALDEVEVDLSNGLTLRVAEPWLARHLVAGLRERAAAGDLEPDAEEDLDAPVERIRLPELGKLVREAVEIVIRGDQRIVHQTLVDGTEVRLLAPRGLADAADRPDEAGARARARLAELAATVEALAGTTDLVGEAGPGS